MSAPPAGAEDAGDKKPSREAAKEQEVSAVAESGDSWRIWLFALEEYRLRASMSPGEGGGSPLGSLAEDESDQDVRLFLEGGVVDPDDNFAAEVSLGLWWDIDGSIPDGNPYGLASTFDYRQPWWDVYTLTAEYRSKGVLRLARGGRQASEHGLPVTFDGASIRLTGVERYLDFFVFGGRSTHFFEVAAEPFEDWIASAGAVVRASPSVRFELDYRLSLEDVLQSDKQTKEGLSDHSYGLSAWCRSGDWLYAKGYLRGLNDEFSHAGAAARMIWQSLNLGVNLSADVQAITLHEISEREDPYFAILGESLPNLRWRLDLWKNFETGAGDYGIHAGWNGKNILKGEEGPFNRNAGRIYLLFEGRDLLVKGLFASIAAEGHYTYADWQLSGDMILTAGGSVGYEYKMLKAEAGTYYQRFKYDYYLDVKEIEDVRTYYGLVSYKALDWLAVKIRYEFERLDRDVHTVTLAVSQMY
jgi:hypothetical protein